MIWIWICLSPKSMLKSLLSFKRGRKVLKQDQDDPWNSLPTAVLLACAHSLFQFLWGALGEVGNLFSRYSDCGGESFPAKMERVLKLPWKEMFLSNIASCYPSVGKTHMPAAFSYINMWRHVLKAYILISSVCTYINIGIYPSVGFVSIKWLKH